MRLIFALAALVAAAAASVSYDGYKVYELFPENKIQEQILAQFYNKEGLDFWGNMKRAGHKTTVMVKPELQKAFIGVMDLYHVKHQLLISNVEETVQMEKLRRRLAPKVASGKISFTDYHTHEEINAYLEQLAADYPETITLETIGQSYEGRDLIVAKICSGVCGSNPGILMEAGIHAREWIAPAMATYIIQELVENAANGDLVANLDWYILPSTNPDGYEYAQSDDRFWRKTRSAGIICDGTDGNRNFGFHWMESGASGNECAETFAGTEAFSEPETTAFKNFVERNVETIKLYIATHSYGEWILYPWGYDEILPDDADELQYLGDLMAAAIMEVAGTEYTVGNSAILLYAAAGASDDWVKSVGIELSYTLELPGGGSLGFDLPPGRIQPVVEETFPGIRVAAEYVLGKFGKK